MTTVVVTTDLGDRFLEVRDLLAANLGCSRAAASARARRARGIVAEGLAPDAANALTDALAALGFDAIALDDTDVPPEVEPAWVASVALEPDGLRCAFPGLERKERIPWWRLRFAGCGLVVSGGEPGFSEQETGVFERAAPAAQPPARPERSRWRADLLLREPFTHLALPFPGSDEAARASLAAFLEALLEPAPDMGVAGSVAALLRGAPEAHLRFRGRALYHRYLRWQAVLADLLLD